ncbi:TerB family tellurite resistance protein [Pseudoprimorskyibacter insulae]|uniref:Co-chaperone DjlA N-terminal domain-containing protein n=1 Tax=Pseudoprimorskyibacter insulae TaxID=1695997 RepID=A0A2R8AYD2_9RHOB|nr:TerB family tellurite resistance protein [Pseudoprimorskyibacter insulae]SPF81045.1 hypothetical protein PRI8871_02862 [Pseudoprimorskyibacter insulae]
MFERILKLLHAPPKKPAPLGELDAQAAVGTLLVRVAMADDAYLFQEVEQIDKVLCDAYGMKPLEAAKFRARCERFGRELPANADLAAVVRDGVSYDDRRALIDALWRIAQADGFTHESEAELVELVVEQIGVSHEDSEAARLAHSIP